MKKRSSGVRLPLAVSRPRSASPKRQERPRTVQEQTSRRDGIGKPVQIQGAYERARPIWMRPARVSTQTSGNQQCAASNRPDARKSLTLCPELDKEKPVLQGRPHTKALLELVQMLDIPIIRCISID